MEKYNQWNRDQDIYVIALSYKPIDTQYDNFINEESKQSDIIHIADFSVRDIEIDITTVKDIQELSVTGNKFYIIYIFRKGSHL